MRNGFEDESDYMAQPINQDPGHWFKYINEMMKFSDKLRYECERWEGVDEPRYLLAKALRNRRYLLGVGTHTTNLDDIDMAAVGVDLVLRRGVEQPSLPSVRVFAFSKGLFVPNQFWNGWRYRVGEHCIIKSIGADEDVRDGHEAQGIFNCYSSCNPGIIPVLSLFIPVLSLLTGMTTFSVIPVLS